MVNVGLHFETTGNKKGPTNFKPFAVGQLTHPCPQPISLCQRHVVEIQRTGYGHPIVFRKDYFTRYATNSSGYGDDYNLVEVINDVVTGK